MAWRRGRAAAGLSLRVLAGCGLLGAAAALFDCGAPIRGRGAVTLDCRRLASIVGNPNIKRSGTRRNEAFQMTANPRPGSLAIDCDCGWEEPAVALDVAITHTAVLLPFAAGTTTASRHAI
jgi:hypothetical protein